MSNIKDTKAYSINDFLNWNDNNELSISPKYQRNAVWNTNAKSYLIDSIIRGFPIPQIFIRQTIDTHTRKTNREIIDGQQRLRSIIEFTEDLFPIHKSHSDENGGLYYSQLDSEIKEDILSYNIAVEIIKIKEDSKIYEMFARLNTNNVALNRQELRNAKYWGDFKVFIYKKSAQHKNFFIENKTFRDKQLSRMLDVDFMNSLVIHLIEGINTDTSPKYDTFYKKYDKEFDQEREVEEKLDFIFNILEKIFESTFFQTKTFHRKNYLYTLFCVLNHFIYGNLDLEAPRIQDFNELNIKNNIIKISSKLMNFEANLNESITDKEDINPQEIQSFLTFDKNHRTRTTSKLERKERIKILATALAS